MMINWDKMLEKELKIVTEISKRKYIVTYDEKFINNLKRYQKILSLYMDNKSYIRIKLLFDKLILILDDSGKVIMNFETKTKILDSVVEFMNQFSIFDLSKDFLSDSVYDNLKDFFSYCDNDENKIRLLIEKICNCDDCPNKGITFIVLENCLDEIVYGNGHLAVKSDFCDNDFNDFSEPFIMDVPKEYRKTYQEKCNSREIFAERVSENARIQFETIRRLQI